MRIPCLSCNKDREVFCKRETIQGYLKRRPICIGCGHIKRIETLGGHAPNWKGGKTIDSKGYVLVWVDKVGYVKEHRLIWIQYYGRIPDGYVVHHRNENKLDNRIENLKCIVKVEHDKLNISLLKNHYNRRIKETENLLC